MEDISKCAVCGKGNQVLIMTSCSHFGACDLDTRPPAMYPFTLFVQRCEHCGYVNTDIAVGNSSIKDFLNSEMYKTCDGINPESTEARDYIQYALVQSYMMVHKGLFEFVDNDGEFSQENIFWGFLNAAWACDDAAGCEPDEEDARTIRSCPNRSLHRLL